MRTSLATLLTLLLIYGCAVGPDYHRPGYPVPQTFRGEGPGIPTKPAEASFGDLKWCEVFKDEKLQELITDGVIMIDTQGAVVGQVNGLSIYDTGEHSFGKPSRITAKTSLGRAGFIPAGWISTGIGTTSGRSP